MPTIRVIKTKAGEIVTHYLPSETYTDATLPVPIADVAAQVRSKPQYRSLDDEWSAG